MIGGFLRGVVDVADLTFYKQRHSVNYYGVFLKPFDKINPYDDMLTSVRRAYYESNLKTQKGGFPKMMTKMMPDGGIYKYRYELSEDYFPKWRVLNTVDKQLECVKPERSTDNYRIEIRDSMERILKVIYFGPYHNWIKTKYYTAGKTEPTVELVFWDKNNIDVFLRFTDDRPSDKPEILYRCEPVKGGEELRRRIIEKVGEPDVCTLCSDGLLYFAKKETAAKWNKYVLQPSLLDTAVGVRRSNIMFEDISSKGEPKKVDLTQTDDIIIPEKQAQDSIVFDLDGSTKLPPSRDLGKKTAPAAASAPSEPNDIPGNNDGEPEFTKLHSDSLIEGMLEDYRREHGSGGDALSFLFGSDDENKDTEQANRNDTPGDDGDNKKAPDAEELDNDLPELDEDNEEDNIEDNIDKNTDENIGTSGDEDEDIEDDDILGGDEDDEDDDDDDDDDDASVEDITREFDIGIGSAPMGRPYEYKRVRPLSSLNENKSTGSTIEFTKPNSLPTLQKSAEKPAEAVTAPTKPVVYEVKEGHLVPSKVINSQNGTAYYYYGELNSLGQRHGRGRTLMHDSLTAYDGEYKNDKRDGFGAYYFNNGNICYIGDWSENRRNGVGISFKSGDRSMYVSKWENNCPVGVGAKFDENGNFKFIARYNQGTLEGLGMTFLQDGDSVLVSHWSEDRMSEKGTLFDIHGTLLYHGTLRGGKRDGVGTQYTPDGQVSYHGGWKNGFYHGEGVLVLRNGCRVSGSFVMGKIEGRAVFTTKRGKKMYEGEWANNRFNGEGKKYDIKTGAWYRGRFVDNKPVGILSCYDRDGNLVYEGELRNEKYHGSGVGYKNGEKVYDGEWKNGVRSGTGSEFEDGRLVYRGKFKDGVRRGLGTSFTEGGKVEYSGHWTDGRKNGDGLLYKDGKPYLAGNFSMGVLDGRVNEIKDGKVIRQCIYSEGVCVYMRDFTEDALSVKYEGYVKEGIYDGMGCGFSAYGEKYFEGIFKAGKPFKNMKVRLHRLDDLPLRPKMLGSEYSKFVKGPNYVIEKEIGSGSYSGLLEGGRPTGKGTMIYTDHGYTGTFEDGIACGLGVIYEWDGSEIQGTFAKTAGDNTTEITLGGGVTYHLIKTN